MQCDCQTKVAEKLAEHVRKGLPEGLSGFDAQLEGYGFAMIGGELAAPLMIPYKGEVYVPKKDPTKGMKRQTINTSVTANFCPFCGTPAKPKPSQHAE